jgi:predicted nucleic acid-binding protein
MPPTASAGTRSTTAPMRPSGALAVAVRFVDTNVLLYAVGTAPADAPKRLLALDLLEAADLALSVQVLQEFYVQATRPSRRDPLSHDQASGLVEAFLRFPVQELTLGVMRAAMQARQRFRLSYLDAAILESARALGCETVLSEDLAHGRDYDGLRVLNPFRPAGASSRS